MPVTALELAILPLKSPNSLNLGGSGDQEIIDSSLKVLKEQHGCRNAGCGLKQEDNEVAVLFVGEHTYAPMIWESPFGHGQADEPLLEQSGTKSKIITYL